MKQTDPFWKLFLPWNFRLLAKQLYLAVNNYKQYGHFSLDKNSPEYFDEAYSIRQHEHVPEHYYEMAEFLPKDEPFTLCDFGCGTGEGLLYIKEKFPLAKLTAIDYSPIAISKAKEKVSTAEFHCLDFTKSPLPGKYDYILTVETLEHFRDPFEVINKLLSFVNRKVLISVPYTEKIEEVGRVNLFAKHLFNFNEESLKVIPNSKVLKITDYFSTTKQKCIFYEVGR